MNLFYAAENLTSAIIYENVWWGAVSLYYFLFIAIRIYLLFAQRAINRGKAKPVTESAVCRRVGAFLLVIDVLLMATTTFSSIFSDRLGYSGLVLLGFSAYTAYSVTASILGILRAKQRRSAVNYAARNMTLTAALASLYNLQYSWLLFLRLEENLRDGVSILVGIIIFSVMLSLAIRLVKRSHGFGELTYNESSG